MTSTFAMRGISAFLTRLAAGHYLDQFLGEDAPADAPPAVAAHPPVGSGHPDVHHVEKARVLYEYAAGQGDELSLFVGEVVDIVEHVGSDWLKGTLHGVTGIFPANFVELFDASGRATVLYDYEAGAPEDLALHTGEEVILLEAIGADWFRGRAGANEGLFPANFVQVTRPVQ